MSASFVLLGLGSNIERERHLTAGLDALAELLAEMQCSPVFESEPVGIRSGPFYNLVVSGYTELSLGEFDRRLKFIEADNGRYAPDRKGLPLDIDVLCFEALVGDFDGLCLPRAEILKNAFVLWPLSLLVPERLHPQQQKPYQMLWQQMQTEQKLQPTAFSWHGRELTPASLLVGSQTAL